MLKHLQTNKNIYIVLGTIAMTTAIAYLSINEVFDFMKRAKDDEEE